MSPEAEYAVCSLCIHFHCPATLFTSAKIQSLSTHPPHLLYGNLHLHKFVHRLPSPRQPQLIQTYQSSLSGDLYSQDHQVHSELKRIDSRTLSFFYLVCVWFIADLHWCQLMMNPSSVNGFFQVLLQPEFSYDGLNMHAINQISPSCLPKQWQLLSLSLQQPQLPA